MTVAFITAWEPRGELPRLVRAWPWLLDVYSDIVIAAPTSLPPADRQTLAEQPRARLVIPPDGAWRRYAVLQAALDTDADHFHYIDLDRAVHWLETRPDELRATAQRVPTADCLILGRTDDAWATHPRCMRDSEALFNRVFSHHLGLDADFGAGARGFSRQAAAFLVAHADADHWADVAWPVLLHRAGFHLAALAVDGLDWETPDQYQPHAVDRATQLRAAAEYDRDPQHWAYRVHVAREITWAGLAALDVRL